MGNRWGNSGNSVRLYFSGLLQRGLAPRSKGKARAELRPARRQAREFPRETGLLLRCARKAGSPFQTTQGNRLSCRAQEGRRGSDAGALLWPSGTHQPGGQVGGHTGEGEARELGHRTPGSNYHRVGDAIQASHPLSSTSPPAPQSLPASESVPMSQPFA